MITYLIILILSLILIAKGSDFLTDSIIPLAKKLQTTSVSLGLILVSAAVSLPEVFVALMASFKGSTDLGFGVVVGSVICNISLMTGLSALVKPLRVNTAMILRDGIFSVIVPILILAVSSDGEINRLEGFSILLLFIPYLANVFLQEKRFSQEERDVIKSHTERKLNIIGLQVFKLEPGFFSFFLGAAFLLLGSHLLSGTLIKFSRVYALAPLFVGLTVGALGTSIPNIVSAFRATVKGLTEVAVSETLGSNIFTLLVTLGFLALSRPVPVSGAWLRLDLPLVILMSLLLFVFMVRKRSISRMEGLVLLLSYVFILIFQTMLRAG